MNSEPLTDIRADILKQGIVMPTLGSRCLGQFWWILLRHSSRGATHAGRDQLPVSTFHDQSHKFPNAANPLSQVRGQKTGALCPAPRNKTYTQNRQTQSEGDTGIIIV